MRCPGCSKTLREVQHHGIHVDVCGGIGGCGSLWLDPGELERWITTHRALPVSDLVLGQPGPSRCPRCDDASLQRFVAGDVKGCTCRVCRGIWLTGAEVQRIVGPADSAGSVGGSVGYAIGDGLVHLLAGIFGAL